MGTVGSSGHERAADRARGIPQRPGVPVGQRGRGAPARQRSSPASRESARHGCSTRWRTSARSRGFLVLHGEAIEFGGEEFAYAPLVAALRDLPAEWTTQALGGLPPEARAALAALLPRLMLDGDVGAEVGSSGRFGQGRLHELVLGLLGRLARTEAPLLVALEDVHWADRPTRDFVAFFARNLRAERIALAMTLSLGGGRRRESAAATARGARASGRRRAGGARRVRPRACGVSARGHRRRPGTHFDRRAAPCARRRQPVLRRGAVRGPAGGRDGLASRPRWRRRCSCAPVGSIHPPAACCPSSPRPLAAWATACSRGSRPKRTCRRRSVRRWTRGSSSAREETAGSRSGTG